MAMVLGLLSASLNVNHTVDGVKSIQVGNTILTNIEIANTPAKKEQGLSGRTEIGENYGMLFVFDKADTYAFWMKEMLVPIDIIWLNENFKVVGLKSRALPGSYPETYKPEQAAKYVLEVKAGIIEKEALKVGQELVISR